MRALDRLTDLEIYRSVLEESAKALNELRCAKQDLDKAISRESFIVVMMNELINRYPQP